MKKEFKFRGKKYIWRFENMNKIFQFLLIGIELGIALLFFFAITWIPLILWG